MTTVMTHEPSTDKPGVMHRLLVPGFWGTVSIVVMSLAVTFDGIFGGDMVFGNNSGGGPTIIPSAVLPGLFAVIGTASIAGLQERAVGRGADAGVRAGRRSHHRLAGSGPTGRPGWDEYV